LQAPTQVAVEALNVFGNDFQKEAKSCPPLVPHLRELVPRIKEMKDLLENYSTSVEEAVKATKEVHPDFDAVIKVLQKSKP